MHHDTRSIHGSHSSRLSYPIPQPRSQHRYQQQSEAFHQRDQRCPSSLHANGPHLTR